MIQQDKPAKSIFSRIISRITSLPPAVIAVIAVLSVAAELIRRFVFGGGCLLKDIFGISCPSCGMSRAFWCALNLDFRAAFYYNPAFWTVPLMLLSGIMIIVEKNHRKRKIFWSVSLAVLLIIFLGVWVWRLITGTTI